MSTISTCQSVIDGLSNVELSTKHTFIHFLPQEIRTVKRSASAPHLSCHTVSAFSDVANVEDCSSQPKVSDESEVSTELAAESTFESASTATSTPSTPMLAEMYPIPIEVLEQSFFLPPMETSTKQVPEVDIFASLLNQAPTQTVTRLNSKAKAWTPSGTSFPAALSSVATQQLHTQILVVMMAVQSMLSNDENISEVQALENGSHWSLSLQVRPENMHKKALIEMLVQDALLRATAQSGNIYIIGHRAQPFLATPMGFTVMLGMVADESTACWDMVSWGYCKRKCKCRWQHPEQLSTVNIMIKIADT